MRLGNLKTQFALVIPVGRPDKNGIVYTREALEKATDSFNRNVPIIYRDNDKYEDGVVIGNTIGETCTALWDDEHNVCELVFDGVVYFGGTECIINAMKEGVVTDFDIVSVGISNR